MAIDIIITLEAISEFHEPKPYEHHPSIRVDGYLGGRIEEDNCVYHRCEDIMGGQTFDNPAEAIAAARAWIKNKANTDDIIQEIISIIGE